MGNGRTECCECNSMLGTGKRSGSTSNANGKQAHRSLAVTDPGSTSPPRCRRYPILMTAEGQQSLATCGPPATTSATQSIERAAPRFGIQDILQRLQFLPCTVQEQLMCRLKASTEKESEEDSKATATCTRTRVHSNAADLCFPGMCRPSQKRKIGNAEGYGEFGEGNRNSDRGPASGRNWLVGTAGKRDLDVEGNGEIGMAYSPPANRRRMLESWEGAIKELFANWNAKSCPTETTCRCS